MTATQSERQVGYLPLTEIKRATLNPKRHAGERIAASISRFGLGELPLLDERTGRIVAGHGRLDQLQAAHDRGDEPPEGVKVIDGNWHVPLVRGWASRSDDDARAYLIASNRTTELGGWDGQELAQLLTDLNNVDPELTAIAGYTGDDLADLLGALDTPNEDDDDEDGDRSGLLSLAGVAVDTPTHQPVTGQVWGLGDRHRLALADVFTGHQLWAHMLHADTILLPYPTILAPFSSKAADHPLLLIQPDTYIAGHMLDKWKLVTGQDPALVQDSA